MINKTLRAVRFVSGSLFALTALGATGMAIAQAGPKPVVASDVEEIYIARSILESRQMSSTAFCAKERTGFDAAFADAQYAFQSIATRGSDGLITDANVQTIGRFHACFGPASDPALMTFYAEGGLGTVTFAGRGECRYAKRDYPEEGMIVMRCFLDLSDISGGRIGGQLTTNTMNSRNAFGDKTDPAGYTQSSIATIRLWRPR
jgi:hypothetical protein